MRILREQLLIPFYLRVEQVSPVCSLPAYALHHSAVNCSIHSPNPAAYHGFAAIVAVKCH
jgi:hypothetical protein